MLHIPPPVREAPLSFDGTARGYERVAVPNVLLTVLTLGGYGFRAGMQTRRYLWARTAIDGAPLAWTGTARALARRWLVVAALLAVIGWPFWRDLDEAYARREWAWVLRDLIVATVFCTWLHGLLLHRALAYRLRETRLQGLSGSGEGIGLRYGLHHLLGWAAVALSLGLLLPWTVTRLWNRRIGAMRFGDQPFAARADWRALRPRFLLSLLAPLAMLAGAILWAAKLGVFGDIGMGRIDLPSRHAMILPALASLPCLALLAVLAIGFHAAFWREAIGTLRLGSTTFAFTARTGDWLRLIAGNGALVVATFGLGLGFVGYRNWRFAIRHLRIYGTLD